MKILNILSILTPIISYTIILILSHISLSYYYSLPSRQFSSLPIVTPITPSYSDSSLSSLATFTSYNGPSKLSSLKITIAIFNRFNIFILYIQLWFYSLYSSLINYSTHNNSNYSQINSLAKI